MDKVLLLTLFGLGLRKGVVLYMLYWGGDLIPVDR